MNRPYRVVCKAGDAHWLEERKKLITGSDVAAILGESAYKSRKRVIEEKAGIKSDSIPDNRYMWFGREMEVANMKAFSKLSGVKVKPTNTLMASTKIPGYGATIDGLTIFPPTGIAQPKWMGRMLSGHWPRNISGLGILEAKNCGEKHIEAWSGNTCPKHYWWQVQAQLDVTGLPWAILMAKIGAADMKAFFIEYDEFSCEHLRNEIQACWSVIDDLKRK